ncbi:hypothetical protein OAN88_01915 [Candidatus Thioglobus sp.]|jgi:hypothetical protein|nr:hypothetical protein [Candidatus Thioglobus sp.]|tara:strand:+ start:286 stop:417 length:132 start_codon:yes stop_codon:yes gene_type:complete
MSSNNLQHIIGGKKHPGSSGRSLDVFNPATNQMLDDGYFYKDK